MTPLGGGTFGPARGVAVGVAVPLGGGSGRCVAVWLAVGWRFGVGGRGGISGAYRSGIQASIGGRVPRMTPTRRTGGAESVASVA